LNFEELKRQLVERLHGPLPGVEGQASLSPRPRLGWRPGHAPLDCRHSAVLLLLYPVSGVPYFILTVRNADLPQHSGQVSLPGGAVESDESFEDAALREAHEEVGLDPRTVRTLGSLSPLHVPVSGFVLHPEVGVTDARPEFCREAREVARILEIPLDRLLDPSVLGLEQRSTDDGPVEIPYFRLDGEQVWGATAMVLAEFLWLLGSRPDPWS
jgi:8-oxo-dGTP pyrophosphatase MutT (NUDIX family)